MVWQGRRSFKRDQQTPASGQLGKTLDKTGDGRSAIVVAVDRDNGQVSV
jgi:hypothetical protein